MSNVLLKTEHLQKRYGPLVAVKDLSLEIRSGEIFGFLGPNGAGKTTAIKMMCGLSHPDGGSVFLHGQPVAGGTPDTRARVGLCPQDIILWGKLTCIEQLQFMGEMYGMRRPDARRSGLALLDALELMEKRDQRAATLSGGMKRRLSIALALVHDPELVVLDEPEAGLDPQSRVQVRDYIRSLAHKKTVILTTHNMDEAERVADRIAIIDHGELLVLDTPDRLKARVGEGDVVEIALNDGDGQRACAALAMLPESPAVDVTDNVLHVRARTAVRLLPAIFDALRAANIPYGEIHLRENTLEDVFIQLTGRRLRD